MNVESAGELDLHSIVEWGDRWLVTFNATKTKLLSINHHRDPLLVPVEMNSIELPEETSIRLLCLTFTRSMDWKPYVQYIAKAASRKVGSLGPSIWLLLIPSCICTNLPSSHICSTVLICGGASRSHVLDLLDRVQNWVFSLVGLSHRLFYKYYYGECSSEFADLVPPQHVTVRSIRFSEQIHRHTVNSPMFRTKVYQSSFFPHKALLWNHPINELFPPDYDLTAFKGWVNKFQLLK